MSLGGWPGGRRTRASAAGNREFALVLLALGGLALAALPLYLVLLEILHLPRQDELVWVEGRVLRSEAAPAFQHGGTSPLWGRHRSLHLLRLLDDPRTFYYLDGWPGAEALAGLGGSQVAVAVWPEARFPLDSRQIWALTVDGREAVQPAEVARAIVEEDSRRARFAYGLATFGLLLLLAGLWQRRRV